jgi:hypothetical protein
MHAQAKIGITSKLGYTTSQLTFFAHRGQIFSQYKNKIPVGPLWSLNWKRTMQVSYRWKFLLIFEWIEIQSNIINLPRTCMELVIANMYWKTTEDSLKAMTPNTQVIPKIGMTAPNVFEADLKYEKNDFLKILGFSYWNGRMKTQEKYIKRKNLNTQA